MLTVGIDIGTSFSSIAFLNEKTGEAEMVKVEGGYGDKAVSASRGEIINQQQCGSGQIPVTAWA